MNDIRKNKNMPGWFQRYKSEVSRFPKLDAETEKELLVRWKNCRDSEARLVVIGANLRHVVRIAFNFRHYPVSLEDLIAEGNVGLLLAFDKYEHDRNTRFITYATFWIRAVIFRLVSRSLRQFRSGTCPYKVGTIFKLKRERAKSFCEFGDSEQAFANLAGKFDMEVDEVVKLSHVLESKPVSLDAPLKDSEAATAKDLLLGRRPSPEDETAGRELKMLAAHLVEEAMASLSSREKYIIRRRFLGLNHVTLAEISITLGVSRERVRQLQSRAMGKIRSFLEDYGIKSYSMIA